jgi:uncharacterized protein YecE (DUF72 family)
MTIRVGIGGWSYEPWEETFYPADLPTAKQLEYASSKLTAIEINATFYRTQSAASFQKWAKATPDDFKFSVKAPRAAVQRKDLREAAQSIDISTCFRKSWASSSCSTPSKCVMRASPTMRS